MGGRRAEVSALLVSDFLFCCAYCSLFSLPLHISFPLPAVVPGLGPRQHFCDAISQRDALAIIPFFPFRMFFGAGGQSPKMSWIRINLSLLHQHFKGSQVPLFVLLLKWHFFSDKEPNYFLKAIHQYLQLLPNSVNPISSSASVIKRII